MAPSLRKPVGSDGLVGTKSDRLALGILSKGRCNPPLIPAEVEESHGCADTKRQPTFRPETGDASSLRNATDTVRYDHRRGAGCCSRTRLGAAGGQEITVGGGRRRARQRAAVGINLTEMG